MAASKDTTSRWRKSIIKESGISIHSYTSHSSRAAASSYAKFRGPSLSTIIHSADWISERTLAWFYDKQIEEKVEFQNYLLQDNSILKMICKSLFMQKVFIEFLLSKG